MWSSCSLTDFGVNRRATSRRLFWCSGSSLLIDDTSPTIFGREPWLDEYRAACFSTSTMSA